MLLYWCINITAIAAICILIFFTVRHVMNRYSFSQGYYIEYFEDDNKSHINPRTGETDPPPDNHIDFD